MITESQILAHAKKECKRLGLRFHRIHMAKGAEAGWPDVEVLGPNGGVLFMETKRCGKRLRKIQEVRRDEIRSLGHCWCKPDTKEDVTAYLDAFQRVCERAERQAHTVPGANYA